MNENIKKNDTTDLSRFLEKPAALPAKDSTPPVSPVWADIKKRQRFLTAVLAVNFALGLVIFTYLIVKTNELSSTVAIGVQQMKPPINYQVSPGETYRLPLP
jgi:hypothetical protein